MGSFNVACSISNISIGCGTKVVFIPLLPSEMNETIGRDYNKFKLAPGYVFLEPASNWVSNEGAYQFYKPFILPIIAEYNDYGGIENVEENITSRAIKEYFGISVEEFVGCIGTGRSNYSYCSEVFETFFEKDKKKLLSDYGIKFNEKWLLDIGFIKLENETFQFKGQPYFVSIFKVKKDEKKHREAGFGYEIKTQDGKVVCRNEDTYDNRERFLENYYDASKYYVGYSEESQSKIKLLGKMSGMFVHYDIYRFMSSTSFSEYSNPKTMQADCWIDEAYVDEYALKKLGFTLRCEDKSIERYNQVWEFPGETRYVIHSDGTWSHISKTSDKHPNGNPKQTRLCDIDTYHPSQLMKAWKKLTGTEIVYDEVKAKESKFAAKFDELRDDYLEYLKEIKSEDSQEEIIEANKKRIEKLNLLTSNPEELKKEIEKIKSDDKNFEIFKVIASINIDSDYLEDDDNDDDNDESLEESITKDWTDERVGAQIIKNLSREYKPFRLNSNPLQKPHNGIPLAPSYDKYNMLVTLYDSSVRDGSIRQDIVDYCRFYWNCYSMNKMLMPAHNGFQDGCHNATYHLALKTVEIMKKKLEEYEEEEEECEND